MSALLTDFYPLRGDLGDRTTILSDVNERVGKALEINRKLGYVIIGATISKSSSRKTQDTGRGITLRLNATGEVTPLIRTFEPLSDIALGSLRRMLKPLDSDGVKVGKQVYLNKEAIDSLFDHNPDKKRLDRQVTLMWHKRTGFFNPEFTGTLDTFMYRYGDKTMFVNQDNLREFLQLYVGTANDFVKEYEGLYLHYFKRWLET